MLAHTEKSDTLYKNEKYGRWVLSLPLSWILDYFFFFFKSLNTKSHISYERYRSVSTAQFGIGNPKKACV